MPTFRKGQRVFCVIGGNPLHLAEPSPVQGKIYTITFQADTGSVRIGELNHILWDDNRFRPLVEKKTDISIFKEILAGTRQPEGVEA